LQQQKDSFLKIKEETGRAIMTISAIDRKELDAKPELLHRTNPPTPPPQLTESPYVVTAIFEPVK